MPSGYLSKEEVAERMRELARHIKNNELAVETEELANQIKEKGDEE